MPTIQSYTINGKKFYKFQMYIGTDPLTGKRMKTWIYHKKRNPNRFISFTTRDRKRGLP
uniref:hypothetical protein n=1 Tax=Lysinibacillus sp. FSL K6-0075 TaxID=2921415 RepID=UPI00406C0506